jgi:subtilisin family serine protease
MLAAVVVLALASPHLTGAAGPTRNATGPTRNATSPARDASVPTRNAAAQTSEYTVLIKDAAHRDAALAAIRAAGGTVLKENRTIGTVQVTAPRTGFVLRVSASDAVYGATHAHPIGRNPSLKSGSAASSGAQGGEHAASQTVAASPPKTSDTAAKADHAPAKANPKAPANSTTPAAAKAAAPGLDPLDAWNMPMIHADKSHAVQPGDRRVRVGVLDDGVDGNHPDLRAAFNKSLSRNFVRDIPFDENGKLVDGPCEFRGCVDPADWADDGHGTHVAGILAAAVNGLGVSGVAPNVTLVSIRGGQDSGFFFLNPVVDALTYGADIGLDVINMSFYLDPWRFNCSASPADSPEEQLEQQTNVTAMQRALDYAHRKGVTLISSMGNRWEDLGHPRAVDTTSPDYPIDAERSRPLDNNTCLKVPAEGNHVLPVVALGPSKAKSDRSDYGVEQTALSAPGGWFHDGFGTPTFMTPGNRILSAYPRNVGVAAKYIDADGNITPLGEEKGVRKHCNDTECAFYITFDGTSMASPHVSGVAALIVSEFGTPDAAFPNSRRLSPSQVEAKLFATATKTPCPEPRTVSYEHLGLPAEHTATCEGDANFNGFYGHGIVDAFAAVGH